MEIRVPRPPRRAADRHRRGAHPGARRGRSWRSSSSPGPQQAAHRASTRPIVVAAMPIPAREPIEDTDVACSPGPGRRDERPGRVQDPAKVIGLVPRVAILAGQPVYANLLASQAPRPTAVLDPRAGRDRRAPTREAWRAVSLTVPDDRAVGGLSSPATPSTSSSPPRSPCPTTSAPRAGYTSTSRPRSPTRTSSCSPSRTRST